MHKELKNLGLSKEWAEDCLRYWDTVLIGDFGHWCWEWDELPIDETCKEFEVCTCFEAEKPSA